MDDMTDRGLKQKTKNKIGDKSFSSDNLPKIDDGEHQSKRKTPSKVESEIRNKSDDLYAKSRKLIHLRAEEPIVYKDVFNTEKSADCQKEDCSPNTKVIVNTIAEELKTPAFHKHLAYKDIEDEKKITELNFSNSLVSCTERIVRAPTDNVNAQNTSSELVINDISQDQYQRNSNIGTNLVNLNNAQFIYINGCLSQITNYDYCKSKIPEIADKCKTSESNGCKSKITEFRDLKNMFLDYDPLSKKTEFDDCESKNLLYFANLAEFGVRKYDLVENYISPTLNENILPQKPVVQAQRIERNKKIVDGYFFKDSSGVLVFKREVVDAKVSAKNCGDRPTSRKRPDRRKLTDRQEIQIEEKSNEVLAKNCGDRRTSRKRPDRSMMTERQEIKIEEKSNEVFFENGSGINVENLSKEERFALGFWPENKWDRTKEPFPHFYNPEIRLNDLLEFWHNKLLHPIFMMKLENNLKTFKH